MTLQNRIIIIPIILALTVLLGCSKNDPSNPDPDPGSTNPDPDPGSTLINYISNSPSNLNVVYFIPANKAPLANYQTRISGIMLHTQEWYKEEMIRNGFGNKTFSLLVDENNDESVKITIVDGEQDADHYPYEGGGVTANFEIEEYFINNPNETTSDHTVVFMPSTEGDNGWNAGGVPFYGMGRWCYVLDYLNFDMDTWRDGTQEGSTNWIGGTIHEIGHGLNLPHNQHKVSDDWTSMMSWGNGEYNNSPDDVHLTKASAVILNNNQVFNNGPASVFYNQTPSHNINSLRIFADNTNLYIRSKFDATVAVNAVIAYNDPTISDTDDDVNAISWATTNIINNDSISIVMPLNDINQDYKQYPFELKIRFCHTNGNFSHESFQYQYENNQPNIDVNITAIEEIDKTNWTIGGASSEETNGEDSGNNGRAIHVIDNDIDTFWHSQWQSAQPNYPHSFTVDLNTDELITGFTFYNRTNKYNGRPKDITIQTSVDGFTFDSLGNYTLGDGTARQTIELTTPITIQSFKIIITNGYDDNSGEDVFFTHLAEVGLY